LGRVYGQGAVRINPENGTIKNFSTELLNGNVVNISGRQGTVWLATLGGASEIKTDDNFSVKNYSQDNGLATDYLYQVFKTVKNRVWFATDRAGVDMLDEKGIHHFTEKSFLKGDQWLCRGFFAQSVANVQNEGLYVFDDHGF